jgi:uncharacterized protein YbaR (Trm112 family)
MSENVVDLVFCPLCKEPLKVVPPDAVLFNGEMVHKECAEKEMKKRNPNKSSFT